MGAGRDVELKEALARDAGAGLEALVHAYQHRLYAFALAMSGDPGDAEEIARDVLLRAHGILRRYPPERARALALDSWLHQVALNLVRGRGRRRDLRVVPPDSEGPAPAAGPGRRGLSATALRELANLVSGLPEHHRVSVVLRCVQTMTYAEVAALMGQPESVVKANVQRGLQALRRRAGWLSEVS